MDLERFVNLAYLSATIYEIVVGSILPRRVGVEGSVTVALKILDYFKLERSSTSDYHSGLVLSTPPLGLVHLTVTHLHLHLFTWNC